MCSMSLHVLLLEGDEFSSFLLTFFIETQSSNLNLFLGTIVVPKFLKSNFGNFLKMSSGIKCKSTNLFLVRDFGGPQQG